MVGTKIPHYSVFGETVEMASIMECSGEPMKIQISSDTKEHLKVRQSIYDFLHELIEKAFQSKKKDVWLSIGLNLNFSNQFSYRMLVVSIMFQGKQPILNYQRERRLTGWLEIGDPPVFELDLPDYDQIWKKELNIFYYVRGEIDDQIGDNFVLPTFNSDLISYH